MHGGMPPPPPIGRGVPIIGDIPGDGAPMAGDIAGDGALRSPGHGAEPPVLGASPGHGSVCAAAWPAGSIATAMRRTKQRAVLMTWFSQSSTAPRRVNLIR